MRSASRTVDEPMRNDDGRAALAQPLQRREHDLLGDGVERGRRLVENQNRRVLQNGACDVQALTLAAGEAAARFGNRRVVALRQPRHEVVRVRRARRLLDFGVGGVEPAVAQVVGDRAGKEHGILQHDADALAQRPDLVAVHVDAVDEHASGRCVVEPRNQADERRLAGAGQADERHHLAGLGLERDVVQHRPARSDRRSLTRSNTMCPARSLSPRARRALPRSRAAD